VSRVLWLTKGLGRGGAERLLTTCATHLDSGRFSVEVAYVLPWKDAYVERLERGGMTVHCLGARHDLDPRWPVRLRRLVRHGNYQLVHTHSPLSAAVARLATIGSPVRVVHTEHNMWSRYRRGTLWANALTYRFNDAVVAVSGAVADTVPRRWLSRRLQRSGVDVLHHGIDFDSVPSAPDSRAKARAELGLPASAAVVGTVGNLTEKKDHYTLVQAFRSVTVKHPDARLVIIGSGPLEDRLRNWVRELDLGKSVVLPGSRDDAIDLMPAFDVFTLSSRFEGLSIALVEALASGVPAVCTRVGGVPEVLDGSGAGDMVPPQRADLLAAALSALLSDHERRAEMARAALVRAEAFDVRESVAELERIYDRVLSDD
jgi:glycosyltransferase involved in cell wall biosynthesis